MVVKLTTLTENTAGKVGLLAEHGLAILVEAHGRRILFDTGQSTTAVHNARLLGVDLTAIDAIVLSHGHNDHAGGLKEVLREVGRGGREVTVVAHPAMWTPRYSVREGERPRFNGVPYRREELESLGARFRLDTGPVALGPGITTTGEVPRVTPFERLDSALKVREGDAWQQDQLLDDLSLVVRAEAGLVVVLGCAHSGIVNTLLHARKVTGVERILAVVGGTHLGFGKPEQVEESVRALREFGVGRLGVSHCTGLPAAARLASEFGDRFFFNSAGTVVDL